jgi:hypothetical protein
MWAVQVLVGLVVVFAGIVLFVALLGKAIEGPQGFFDELGTTVARVAPQPAPDIESDDELKTVIRAMPEGKIRVASVVAEQDRVVFTVTADRDAVHAAVTEGDELRIARDGSVEIVPTGLPGVADRLQRALEDLRRRFFGGP